MAMRCPKKKEIIKIKKQQDKEGVKGYNTVTRSNLTQSTAQPQSTNNMHTLINTSIVHAHFKNMDTPGTYEAELNKMLIANDLRRSRYQKILHPITSYKNGQQLRKKTQEEQSMPKEREDTKKVTEETVRLLHHITISICNFDGRVKLLFQGDIMSLLKFIKCRNTMLFNGVVALYLLKIRTSKLIILIRYAY